MNFEGIEIMQIWCVGLIEQIHFWWVWKFYGMCKSYLMGMEIFIGIGMENFCGDMIFYVGRRIFWLDIEKMFGHGNFCWS